MQYGIIQVPLSPVRKYPDHPYEMTNQLVYGEAIEILEEQKSEWISIKSMYDGYEGWITKSHIMTTEVPMNNLNETFITTEIITHIKEQNTSIYLPFGSFIHRSPIHSSILSPSDFTINSLKTFKQTPSINSYQDLLYKWLNAPYLWGGKSVLGIDCSGFVQNFYKELGIILPRDAYQQALEGTTISHLKDVQIGDLAFFETNHKITHVGVVLNSTSIIHAAGKVRIDTLNDDGIVHVEANTRTHQLNCIKRIIN